VAVTEQIIWERPFCRLIHFSRDSHRKDPKLLIVAPLSGHHATLLRGTVEAFLPAFDVYITDWLDARMVPLAAGAFGLDHYIDYVIDICRFLQSTAPETSLHAVGVCQPTVPLMAATALLEAEQDPSAPSSATLIGGPVDPRKNETAVTRLARERGTEWFRQHCIHKVPIAYPGAGRDVYPGFLQLSGFLAMNLGRHIDSHCELFNHYVQGDGESAAKHCEFYDEYMAVMDLDGRYYIQTIDEVFVRNLLPKGEMRHRAKAVNLSAIRQAGLMTVEGGKDDISGVGQTSAALDLCANVPDSRKQHHIEPSVGHYGIFNGARFRAEIAPRICKFIASIEQSHFRSSRTQRARQHRDLRFNSRPENLLRANQPSHRQGGSRRRGLP
jgi:poly(3-hydroxybutyrate) depolymerase